MKSLSGQADQFAQLTAQINLATGGGDRFIAAQQQVLAISQSTRSDLASTTELYGKSSARLTA
ncbi:hypothetical protein HC761_00050 [bacterium]|nr:hypothetical protein [bacterium]